MTKGQNEGTVEILLINPRFDRGKLGGMFCFRNVVVAAVNAVSMAVADNVRIGKKKDQKTGVQVGVVHAQRVRFPRPLFSYHVPTRSHCSCIKIFFYY